MAHTSEIRKELLKQDDFIREILSISRCPALSIGILHEGEIIHTAHYGTRDVSKDLLPNDDTMYRVASLTKSLTASAVALLVTEGRLAWDEPIRSYLPEFQQRRDDVSLHASLRDLLSNRTGLANGDYYWGQQHGEFLLPHEELVRMAVHIEAVRPFRKKFVYAGWNYGLVTEVVEAVAGMTLGQFIEQRFLRPLGMFRTTLAHTEGYTNLAYGYALDQDGSRHHVDFQQMNDGLGMAGAYGGKSSVKDLLLMYQAMLRAQQDQSNSEQHTTQGSPFTYTKDIFAPHIPVTKSTSYCLGLYKTTLPGLLGVGSLNTGAWLGPKNSPVMGDSRKGTEIWHHVGSMPVCLASAFLVPATQTAVVVLSNAIGLMDPTDFISQHLLAKMIGEISDTKRLIDLANTAKAANLQQYPRLEAKLLQKKTGMCNRAAESYVGHYWNEAGNFCLTISLRAAGTLRMSVQDVPLTGYNLEPYDGDTWWWPPNRKEELCEKGMAAFMHPKYHLIFFASSSDDGKIDQLTWHHDPTASPETFHRSSKKPSWKGYTIPKARL